MTNHRTVSDDDMQLFRDAVGDVKPVDTNYSDSRAPRPHPVPAQKRRDDQKVFDELLSDPSESEILETGEHLSYRKNGVQANVARKLRRGAYTIQAELDLHGYTVEQARTAVRDFLHTALQKQMRCICIIHGKGRKKAERAPRLKPMLNHWLQRKREVLAFCSARPEDGGTGAVYVLLGHQNR